MDVIFLSLLQEHNFDALRSLNQPLLDCMLYLTQYFYVTKLSKSVYP